MEECGAGGYGDFWRWCQLLLRAKFGRVLFVAIVFTSEDRSLHREQAEDSIEGERQQWGWWWWRDVRDWQINNNNRFHSPYLIDIISGRSAGWARPRGKRDWVMRRLICVVMNEWRGYRLAAGTTGGRGGISIMPVLEDDLLIVWYVVEHSSSMVDRRRRRWWCVVMLPAFARPPPCSTRYT